MVNLDKKPILDDIDWRILRILQSNGRITNTKLAQAIGLSAPPVLERVKKLERAGIIKGYRTVLDAQKLDHDFFVYLAIKFSVQELINVKAFEDTLAGMAEVMECHHIAGDIDFLIKINVADQEHYKRFVVEKLARIKGINNIHSWVVLSTIKDSAELNLNINGDA